jgi:hypothetical protein
MFSKFMWFSTCFGIFALTCYWFFWNMEELLDEKKEEDMRIEAHQAYLAYSKDIGRKFYNDHEFEERKEAFAENYMFVNFYGKKNKVKFALNQFADWT